MRRALSISTLLITMVAFTGCKKQNNFYDIPNVPLSEYIYLSNPLNLELQFLGGWVYRQVGYKGLIIYRRYMNYDANDFIAYERACPVHFADNCGALSVKDGINIECECDNLQYSLFDGSPYQNNPSPSVKFYRTTFDGSAVIYVEN